MEMCDCPGCGAPAEVLAEDSYDVRPGDTVRVRCVARHWFLGPRERLVPHERKGAPIGLGRLPAAPPEPRP
jgi:hypothetical protein